MATYYPSLCNQQEDLPTSYPGDLKLASYPEPPFYSGNIVAYMNQASSIWCHSETLTGSSLSPHNHVEMPPVGGENEMVFVPPTSDTESLQSIDGQSNPATWNPAGDSATEDSLVVGRTKLGIVDGEQDFLRPGLSLSLGTEMQSAVSVPSFQWQYPDLASPSSSYIPISGKETTSCKWIEKGIRQILTNSECLPSSFAGENHRTIKMEALCNHQCSREMHSEKYLYKPSDFANTIMNSKYLEAAKQLLDEVFNVQMALKQPESNKHQSFHGIGLEDPKETDQKSRGQSLHSLLNGISLDPSESITNSSSELSAAERQDLQNKKTKLLSMLNEVDRRYKCYHHQMQTLVSSFDIVAGCGAAKPYTALALQTISCHVRCLCDAITGQIQVTRRGLGEQDTSPSGQGGIPRLRYVDHRLRQQRALQQLGVMQHTWRPQRGLPESSVSILRDWLFEHFLHPYPKDSEKIMLARQTGLTRNQVANWFINARVRLWKPMVEEMYKEEFGNSEVNSKCSLENAAKARKNNSSASEDLGEELQ